MRKAVITTFFKAENYGAALQAYALEDIIQNRNYKPEILNYRDAAIEDLYNIFYFKRETFYLSIRAFLGNIIFYRRNRKRHLKFQEFQRDFLKIGEREYRSAEDVKRNPPNADIYITGSDQVWNASITEGLSDIYTLNFGEGQIKKVAYAASIGSGILSQSEKENLKEKISGIDCVSVRELTAGQIVGDLLPLKPVAVTLDPVLLRNQEEWEADLTFNKRKKDKYILAYHVEEDEEYRKAVNALSQMTGLKILHFDRRNRFCNALKSAYTAGPLEFVSLIQHAEYVITTSFHGTAFSIIFHKKFWVFPHRQTGSRVNDLLSLLGISERAVQTFEEFSSKDYDSEIDYVRVEKILSQERNKSLEWLENALKKSDDLT